MILFLRTQYNTVLFVFKNSTRTANPRASCKCHSYGIHG